MKVADFLLEKRTGPLSANMSFPCGSLSIPRNPLLLLLLHLFGLLFYSMSSLLREVDLPHPPLPSNLQSSPKPLEEFCFGIGVWCLRV